MFYEKHIFLNYLNSSSYFALNLNTLNANFSKVVQDNENDKILEDLHKLRLLSYYSEVIVFYIYYEDGNKQFKTCMYLICEKIFVKALIII